MTGIEVWKTIPSIPTHEVSSLGRVRHGKTKNVRKPYLVKEGVARGGGYHTVNIFIETEDRNRHFSVHRLVCGAFHGPCPPDHQCAHANGIRNDNRPENLRWATPQENCADKHVHGTTVRGAKHKLAKLTLSDIKDILKASADGATSSYLARQFGVSRQVIWRIKRGMSYASEGVSE